jgi:hypothetical protein
MDILKIKDRIQVLLERYPHLRDDDHKLIANVWHQELNYLNIPQQETLSAIAENKLSNPESIRRSRQGLQQKYPALRGASYNKRHNHIEVVKEQLKAI